LVHRSVATRRQKSRDDGPVPVSETLAPTARWLFNTDRP
jgi:hypothetical protein